MLIAKRIPSFVAVATFAVFSGFARAQSDRASAGNDGLYKTIAGLDTALFDAYNHCDLDKLASMVAEDLEFYHDKTGLAVGRKPFVEAIKNNICGKVHRELVAGSLEVYPLKDYGAVEIGVHRFTHPDDPSELGEAKFVTIWHEVGGQWQVSRAISFDHHAVDR